MRMIALGADHAGFPLKEDLKAWLLAGGHRVIDFGTHSSDPVDYPDYALLVADAVTTGTALRGVLICGTGSGMAIAANKVPGVRAAACADPHAARLSREHNDANVLALGGRTTPRDKAIEIVEAWLDTAFLGGRHTRRVAKLGEIERASAGRDTRPRPDSRPVERGHRQRPEDESRVPAR